MTTKVHAASSVKDFYNVAKSLLNDLKMVTKDSEWVNATNKQLDAEAADCGLGIGPGQTFSLLVVTWTVSHISHPSHNSTYSD